MKFQHALTVAALASLTLVAAPASAVTIVYQAILTGAAEAPPNASAGVGVALVTIDDVLKTMRVQTTFAGLTGNVSASHIHCCTATPSAGTAGVATTTPTFPGFPLGGTFGSYDVTFDMTLASSFNPAYVTANGGSTATAFTALTTGMAGGRSYFNIHSTFAPGGEIRGFLSAVPETSTYAMMLAGLAGMGLLMRRRVG